MNQDRVTPFGKIIPTKARGVLMGNRGVLHDVNSETEKLRWDGKRWIICLLSKSGLPEKRDPNIKYTRLFFLDEATALSAGHRPCAYCRKEAFHLFVDAWLRGNPEFGFSNDVRIEKIDSIIHEDRVTHSGEKKSFASCIDDLPDGVMIEFPENTGASWLLWNGELHRWEPAGYPERRSIVAGQTVTVLTPKTIVRAITAGYTPKVALG